MLAHFGPWNATLNPKKPKPTHWVLSTWGISSDFELVEQAFTVGLHGAFVEAATADSQHLRLHMVAAIWTPSEIRSRAGTVSSNPQSETESRHLHE